MSNKVASAADHLADVRAALKHLDRAYEALAPFRAVGLDTRVVDAEIDLARLALTLEAK